VTSPTCNGGWRTWRRRVGHADRSGGVGKTRAAIEIGWLVVDEFVDGVWLVELAPVADPELAVTTIATALGAHLQPGSSMIESIVDWCLGRRMLLIVDNCEHVLDPVIDVVAAIVAACPTVTIIATSREPLGVAGETVARIESLDPGTRPSCSSCVPRSADAGSSPPTPTHRDSGICRRLDGIPLAIELAAARIRSLSPAELLERLDDRFRLLRGGGRGGLERHQTLRATVPGRISCWLPMRSCCSTGCRCSPAASTSPPPRRSARATTSTPTTSSTSSAIWSTSRW
jgi:predicted ATPase